MTTIIGGKLMQVDKSALRNVVRHTDTHNRIKEMDEMWKQLKKQRCNEKFTKREPRGDHSSRTAEGQLSYNDRIDRRNTVKATKIGPRAKISTNLQWEDSERWGHSGYKELYPEDVDEAAEQSSIGNMIEETKDKQDSLDEGIMKRWKKSRCRPKGESRRPVRGFIEGKKRETIHDGEGWSSRSMQQDKFYRRRDHPKHKQRQRSRSVSSEDFYLRTAAGHIGRQKTSSSNQERVKECVTADSKEQGTFISSNVKLFEVEQKPNLICEHHANHKTVIQTVSIDMHNEKSSLPTNGRLIGRKKEPIRKRIYEQDKFGGDKSIPYRKTPGNFNRKGEEKSSIDKITEERRIKVECESTNDEKCLVPKFVDGKFIERYQNHKARTFKKGLPVKPNFADDLSSKGNTDNRQMSHTRKRKKHSIHKEKSSNSDTPWEEIHHTEMKERKRSKKIYRSDADVVPFELPVDWQRKKLSGTKFPNKKYDDYVEGSIIVPIKAEVVQSEGKKTRQKKTRRKSHDSDSTSGIHRKKRKKSHKRKQSKALIKGSIS